MGQWNTVIEAQERLIRTKSGGTEIAFRRATFYDEVYLPRAATTVASRLFARVRCFMGSLLNNYVRAVVRGNGVPDSISRGAVGRMKVGHLPGNRSAGGWPILEPAGGASLLTRVNHAGVSGT